MKVFMTGGTGFVGSALTQHLTSAGHQVTILTRSVRKDRRLPDGAGFLEGDPMQPGSWMEAVSGHDVVVNLAGASIFERWTPAVKERIRQSRIRTTRHVVEAMGRNPDARSSLLLSTSAVGYYGFCGDERLAEDDPPGTDFLASICREWEAEARKAEAFGVRVIICRFGLVLGKGGGALGEMLPLFRKGLGSAIGKGTQWFSWIHQDELVRIYLFLLENTGWSGPVNCTAPHPVRNREMTRVLGEMMGKRTILPAVPAFVIKLKMGEFGTVLLNGQRVLPGRLLQGGYTFCFPHLREALSNLLVLHK
jgi:hypothetical protein